MSGADFSSLGIVVGHATDAAGGTGVTVIRGADGPRRGAAHAVGRATGTREMDAASPRHLVDRLDAVVLTGGSAYGLESASGVMRWMEERGRGFRVGPGVVPIVPAAVVFDLGPFGRFDARPTPDMAYAACEAARATGIAEGSVGAGTGATVGKGLGIEHCMKGGVGCAMASAGDIAVGAVAVVNAFGDVRDAGGAILAGARNADGTFADTASLVARGSGAEPRFRAAQATNTTIACLATSVAMSRIELEQVACAASAALFRRITPAGTSVDGDVIFVLGPMDGPPGVPMQVEALAVQALEGAIERAVRLARGRDGIPGLADGAAQGPPVASVIAP